MKIDELIERLEKMAFDFKWQNGIGDKYVDLANKAAKTIKLLWEVARENRLEQYKMLIDEWRGDDDRKRNSTVFAGGLYDRRNKANS